MTKTNNFQEMRQFKITLDKELSEQLPLLTKVFFKRTYVGLFRFALEVLSLLANVLQKGHRLAEIDEQGNVIQCFVFPDIEAYNRRIKRENEN